MPTLSIKQPSPFTLLNPISDLFKTRCTAAVIRKCYKVSVAIELLFIQHSKGWVFHLYLFNYLLSFRFPCFTYSNSCLGTKKPQLWFLNKIDISSDLSFMRILDNCLWSKNEVEFFKLISCLQILKEVNTF